MNTIRRTVAALVVLACTASAAVAQQVIYVVRHAERADSAPGAGQAMTAPANDPPLSAAGHARAERLATMLRSADIRQIIATEYQRTRQTAAPLAKALNLEVTTAAAREPATLLARIREANGNVLVVGHSNTVPELLKTLGVKDAIAIPESEYDNLFIVVRPATGEPILVRLRF
jgi:broad specificity phosphatase PhoE